MGSLPNFRLETQEDDFRTTIKLGGELDSASCAELVGAFEAAIPALAGRDLVIDLGELTFIDSSGMRAIIMIERRTREEGIALGLTRPPAAVTELLRITGITGRVELTPSPGDFSAVEPFVERIDIELDRAPDAPARARAELRQAITGRLSEQDVATATLLTSELVTNAVIHPGPERRRLGRAPDHPVRRPHPGRGHRPGAGFDAARLPPARPGEAGGHGLFVVDGLSSRWGTSRRAAGDGDAFCVWFELDADLEEEAGDQAAQFSTPSRSQQYSSRHSLASSMHRASESQGSTVSNA